MANLKEFRLYFFKDEFVSMIQSKRMLMKLRFLSSQCKLYYGCSPARLHEQIREGTWDDYARKLVHCPLVGKRQRIANSRGLTRGLLHLLGLYKIPLILFDFEKGKILKKEDIEFATWLNNHVLPKLSITYVTYPIPHQILSQAHTNIQKILHHILSLILPKDLIYLILDHVNIYSSFSPFNVF